MEDLYFSAEHLAIHEVMDVTPSKFESYHIGSVLGQVYNNFKELRIKGVFGSPEVP